MKYQMTLLIYVGLLLVFQTPVDTVCGTVRANVFVCAYVYKCVVKFDQYM